MSKAKAQGTRLESWVVDELTPFETKARRLAEGGAADEGDVEVYLAGDRWILDCKARQQLSIQAALAKAKNKAGGPAALIWKRLVPGTGSRRTPVAGISTVVVLEWNDFLNLLAAAQGVAAQKQISPDVSEEKSNE